MEIRDQTRDWKTTLVRAHGDTQPSVCFVSSSEAFPEDLREHWGASYALRALQPEDVLEAEPDALAPVFAASIVLLVDWDDHTAAVIPQVRRVAGPHRVPIFAVCGSALAEHVAALVVGADGTLERPLRPLLLEARLLAFRRLVAHVGGTAGDGAPFGVKSVPAPPWADAGSRGQYRVGPLLLDRAARCVRLRGAELQLTPKEFDLLAYLMTHAGFCRTRDEILDHAWGIGFDTGTNILDVHIYELRKKLRRHGLDRMLQTVRGVGFRMVPPVCQIRQED